MGTVDVSPENVMPDRRQSRSGRSWGGRDEIFVRKVIMDLENRVKSNHRVRGGIVCMDG